MQGVKVSICAATFVHQSMDDFRNGERNYYLYRGVNKNFEVTRSHQNIFYTDSFVFRHINLSTHSA